MPLLMLIIKLFKTVALSIPKQRWVGEKLINLCLSSSVLKYIQDNKKFVNFYRFTDTPDEMVFQTIILNSPFKGNVKDLDAYIEWSNSEDKMRGIYFDPYPFNLRYIDWSLERRSGAGSPAILDENDFPHLKESECLFARKMDPKKSNKLLDLIDSELL